ncbi:MAG: ABC transporter permease [Firmicutes bacterium]|nr:ABC transporter permease [Bacillota bacterium]
MRQKTLSITLFILSCIVVLALLQPWLPLPDPDAQNVRARLKGPSAEHLFGTDEFGRDLLSRTLRGTRTSLIIALSATAMAAVLGTAIGTTGAYFRGATELVAMRLVDLLLMFPPIVLAIVVVGLLGSSKLHLILAIGTLYVAPFARLSYSSTKSLQEMEFVQAAHALGASAPRIIVRHVLPNILSPLVVQLSLSIAAAVLLESGLSFLGIGVSPPDASLGLMIGRGRGYLYQNPWYVFWPAAVLSIITLCANVLGDSLRDRLDPRLHRSR